MSFEMIAAQRARFERLCHENMTENPAPMGEGGIGTLGEKRMHAIIKRYLCEDTRCHEVGIDHTRFVADVCVGGEVFEVQTGSFFPMKRKIAHYLEQTDLHVTVVHPIASVKWLSHIDPATQELLPRKKSPKHGTARDLLPRMYHLLAYLGHPRLHFRVLLLEVEEFRMPQPKRRRGSAAAYLEHIPLALLEDITFDTPQDFRALLPTTLTSPFTVRMFSAQTKIRGRDAYSAVRSLAALGVIEQTDPIGRSMAWRRVESTEVGTPDARKKD